MLQRMWLDAMRLGEGYGPPDEVAEGFYGKKGYRVSQAPARLMASLEGGIQPVCRRSR